MIRCLAVSISIFIEYCMYTNIKTMQEKLSETIKVVKTKFREEYVQLTTLQLIVQDMYCLLMILDGRWLLLMSLEAVSCACFALLLSWLIKLMTSFFPNNSQILEIIVVLN